MPSVTINWGSSNNSVADEYEVYRSTTAFTDEANASLLGSTSPSINSYTDDTAENATGYYYMVIAMYQGDKVAKTSPYYVRVSC